MKDDVICPVGLRSMKELGFCRSGVVKYCRDDLSESRAMKKLIAGGFLALCVLFIVLMAYLVMAARAPACEFGPCVVKFA